MTDPIWLGAWASLLAGAATAVGSLPVLFGRNIPDRWRDSLLGVAGGVMLAATFFSLIQPAIALAAQRYGGQGAAALVVAAALAGGVLLVWLLEKLLANAYRWRRNGNGAQIDSVWVFVAAVTLHNIPEGLAVGVGFGGGDVASGTSIAVGIGLQNMPEGLAVALALLATGYSRTMAFVIASLTGLIEAPAGLLGAAAVAWSQPLMPWALALAAGAMLFVIVQELIPESYRHGYRDEATLGLVAGFVVMLMLDVAFS